MTVRTLSAAVLSVAASCIPLRADGQSVVTLAGGGAGDGGPAVSAGLGSLRGLVVDSSGNVFLADLRHRSIRRVDRTTGVITTILQLAENDAPLYLALGAPGRLLFTSNLKVEEVDLATGRRRAVAGNGKGTWWGGVLEEGRPATEVAVGPISGIAVGPGGDVYIGDPARAQILRVDPATGVLGHVFRMDRASAASGRTDLGAVCDLAVDAAGRLYFSDQRHRRIFRVESGRAIAVAGGEGRRIFPAPGAPVGAADDARPATSSWLDLPGPLAFRSADELFFGEDHGTVRRVNRFERIRTFLGPTLSASWVSGVAFDREGTLFVASHPSFGVGQILRIPFPSGVPEVIAGSGVVHCCGDGTAAVQAELSEPEGIAITPDGTLVIADRGNHRIRQVSSRTGRIATIAGGGVFALPGSRHVVFHPVRSAPPPGRIRATLFEVPGPRFVASDRAGNIYFAQQEGPVYRVDAGDGTLLGLGLDRKNALGPKFPDGFSGIGGIAVDAAGTVFVAAEHRIFRISPGGGLGVLAGTGHEGFAGDGDFALLADLSRPCWPTVDGNGALYFADAGNSRIRRVDRSGGISTVAGNGLGFASGEGQAIRESIGAARGLALDPLGNLVYSTADNRIWRLTLADGKLRLVAGGEPPAIRPLAVAIDQRGTVCFSEPDSSRVRAIRP